MKRTLMSWILLFGALAGLSLAGPARVTEGVRHAGLSDLPRLELEGLNAPVRVLRDGEGMPHILARNDQDAYFVAGYVQAQDRLFQMDLTRRQFSGTLAELLGPVALPSDIQFRTLGLRRAAEASLSEYSPESRILMEAYARGVNAWLEAGSFELPPEYQRLELTGVAPWTVLDTLTVTKGIAFGFSFDLLDLDLTRAQQAFETAGQEFGFDGNALFSQDLYRVEPFDSGVTVDGELSAGDADSLRPAGEGSARSRSHAPSRGFRVSETLIQKYLDRLQEVPFLASRTKADVGSTGSNAWVFGGQHTASGYPLLANDPHLSLNAPSTFYEMHIQVTGDPGAGKMNVIGVGFPGTPAIIQGCNEKICWGNTVNPIDVTDIYQEELAVQIFPPAILGTKYEGETEPVVTISQDYRVNQVGNGLDDDLVDAEVGALEGGTTILVPRRNMGPIVQVDAIGGTALSVQYTGWSATLEGETFLRLGRSYNLAAFQEAIQYFDAGGQNWFYADVEGNIAYFTADELPLREDLQKLESVDGSPPWQIRDGTHGFQNEWMTSEEPQPARAIPYEIVPFDELPRVINPTSGVIANANNDPIGVTLDNNPINQLRPGGGLFYLNVGYTSIRKGRLDDIIEEKLAGEAAGLTVEDMMVMQGDNQLLDAQVLLPHLLAAFDRASEEGAPTELGDLADDPGIAEAVGRLRSWDFSTPTGIAPGYDPGDGSALQEPTASEVANSVAATIYAFWRSAVVKAVIDSTLEALELGDVVPDSERSLTALQYLLENFDSGQGVGASGVDFFTVDEVAEPEDERDYVLLKSLEGALELLASEALAPAFGRSTDQLDYRWGYLHRIVFDHPLGGDLSVPGAGGFADLAPDLPGISRAGGYEVLDASGHSARADGLNEFRFGSGPARRFVAELHPDGIRAYQIIPGGAKGNPEEEGYTTQLDRWLRNEYRPLEMDFEVLEVEKISDRLLLPEQFRLYLPYFQGDESSFTGVALADLEESGVSLEISALGSSGELLDLGSNPAQIDLSPGAQRGRLAREIFEEDLDSTVEGWIQIEALFGQGGPTVFPGVGSFVQFGDFALSGLDGGTAVEVASRGFYLSRVYEGERSFFGQDARTYLAVANAGELAADVDLRLVRVGETEASQIQRRLPAGGWLFESVGELFDLEYISGGYVEMEAVDPEARLVGFEMIHLPQAGTVIGLNALYAPGSARSYSAQLASSASIFTSVAVINTAEFDREIVLKALRGGVALPDLSSNPILLRAGEMKVIEIAELFPGQEGLIASLTVESDQSGVIGDVLFGDPVEGRFSAALPFQLEPFRRAVFSHVANLGDFFTGLALFNPSTDEVIVTVEVFEASGEETGRIDFPLGPGARTARTLVELIPGTAGQAGGYIIVSGTGPLVGQEIFGTFDLRLQSAVPPTVLE